MAALPTRNLDESVKRRLQSRAASRERSMEAVTGGLWRQRHARSSRKLSASPTAPPVCSPRCSSGSPCSAEWTLTAQARRARPRCGSQRMIVLGTNVVSELMRPEPTPRVTDLA